MAETINAEVRPTRQLFWLVAIVPFVIDAAKSQLLPDTYRGPQFIIPDLVFCGGPGLVLLVGAFIYARGTRLQRRGNDLVFINRRGRGQRVRVTDVDLAEVVPFDPSGKRYGRDARNEMDDLRRTPIGSSLQ
jgi:hypothetical protein